MTRFSGIGRAAALAALVAMAGCAAPPPPRPVMSPWDQAARFGYSDRSLDAGQFEVTYKTPYAPVADDPTARSLRVEEIRELADDLAQLRAAELARAQSQAAFAVLDRKFDTTSEVHMGATSVPRYGFGHTLGGVRAAERPGPDVRTTWMQGETTLRIVLKRAAGPGDIDAAQTIARLGAKYEGVMASDVD